MAIPDANKPLDVLNDFLVESDNHIIAELEGNRADDFQRLRAPYFIDGDTLPFTIRPATDHEMATLWGGDHTFVEDWLHVPTGRIIHIAYQRRNFGGRVEWDEPVVFLGTREHFVFAMERGDDGEDVQAVIPAPKEQWDAIGDRTGQWWGRGLYNDEYTDFFMHGLYGLPMHYRLRSRNDYESTEKRSATEIVTELTALGYRHVGNITWSDDGMTEGFEPASQSE